MGKIGRHIFGTLLVCIILCVISPKVVSAADVHYGTCGENVNWYCEDGVIVITGTGAIQDWDYSRMMSNEHLEDFWGQTVDKSWYPPWHLLDVTEVIIEEGITHIGDGAFWKCKNLVSVRLPKSLKSIGEGAFYSCEKLQIITLPEDLTEIKKNAFEACKSLRTIKVPDKIKIINQSVFSRCESLQQVVLPKEIEEIQSHGFNACKALTEITIPQNVTYIGRYAFNVCSNLTKIEIPEGVTSIDEYAFMGCDSLKVVKLPQTLTSINRSVFSGCESLEEIQIPKGTVSIGDNAFSECSNLKRIDLPYGLRTIGERAFSGCGIESIKIPYGVYEIRSSAFFGNRNLRRIDIPASVRVIYDIFGTSRNVTIHGVMGSPIHIYAKEYNIPFVAERWMNFQDIYGDEWYCEAVEYMYETGIMRGINENTFCPMENMNRAQFAVMLYRLGDSPEVTYTEKFPDVEEYQWYTDAVMWASDAGIIKGYSGTGNFGPQDILSREQAVVMMQRFGKYYGYEMNASGDLDVFTDAAIVSDYAKEAFEWGVGNGIITGKANTLLDPQGRLLRGEAAGLFMRFMEKYRN